MKPWQKLSSTVILGSMHKRLSEGRVAGELEALAELQVLDDNNQLAAMSFNAIAIHFGWTRGHLRTTLKAWGRVVEAAPDAACAMPSIVVGQQAVQQSYSDRTTTDQQSDNDRTTTVQHAASLNLDFGTAPDNNRTVVVQQSDNNPTTSCARASSSVREEDRDRDLSTRARPTEPALFAEPAPPAPAKRRKSTPTGPSEDDVVAACAPAWRAIRGLTGSETPKTTDQRALLALWRGVRGDYTEASAFGADLLLVATWAHSDEPAARQTIQGLNLNGSRWGIDRSRDVATITRQDRWADRLAKARQFAQAASEARQAVSTGPDLSGPILTERERASMDLTRRQNEFIAKQNEEWGSLPHSQNRYRRLNDILADQRNDLTVT